MEGNSFYSVGDFDSSIDLFLKSLKADSDFCPSIYKLGLSYKKNNLFDEFLKWFLVHRDKMCYENKDDVNFQLGEFYFLRGEILKAKDFILSVKDTLKYINYSNYKQNINYNIENTTVSLVAYTKTKSLNRSFFQYSPQYNSLTNELFYTSRLGQNLFDDENIFSFSLPQNKFLDNNIFSYLNTDNNEGSPSISNDGNLMVFTSCQMNFKKNSCDIYYVEKKGNKWSNPVKFSNDINSEYWDSQPFLYNDKIFFVSNRPGGKGGRDIYYSIKKKNIGWSQVFNVEEINSNREEVSPFIKDDIIYFSSNRKNSYGGYDIFLLDNLNSYNKSILNLGSSINSHLDETSIFLSEKNIFLTIENKLNQKTKSEIVIGDIKKEYKSNYKFKLFRTFDAITNKEIQSDIYFNNDSIKRRFETNVHIDNKFFHNSIIIAESKGYFPKVIDEIDKDTIDSFLYRLENKIILENIYFDFDSYKLDSASKEYLDIISNWLNESKIKEIEIIGHTDNIGTENYNLKLSRERAKSVYEHMILFNFKNLKINYKGLGSSVPIYEHYEGPKNRRIEFTIINQ